MPDWKPDIRSRLSQLSIAPSREAEIVEELTQHLDDRWRELVARGETPDDAASQHGQKLAFELRFA